MSGFWSAGFWATGFWQAGFFGEEAPPIHSSTGGGRFVADDRERLFREHWDYIDGLREIQVLVADDLRGAIKVAIPAQMVVPPDLMPPAMRGTVRRVSDVLGDPMILAALAVAIVTAMDDE